MQPAQATRPDFLPENYWDPEQGGIKLQDFGQHYAELSNFHKEHTAHLALIPTKADDYELALPEGFKLPDGVEKVEFDPKDPRVTAAREWALTNKIPKPLFQQMLALNTELELGEQKRFDDAVAEQKSKLGANGPARIDAVQSALGAAIGPELAGALIGTTFTERQVAAFEKIVSLLTNQGAQPIPPGGQQNAQPAPAAGDTPLEKRMFPNHN